MPVACYRRKRSQLTPRNGDFEHLYLTFATASKMFACYEMNELKAQKHGAASVAMLRQQKRWQLNVR